MKSSKAYAPKKLKTSLVDLKAIPLPQIANALGIKIVDKSMRCPLPQHNDKSPSFSYLARKNTWKCFGCGEGGTNIDFVMAINGCTFNEAVRFIEGGFRSAPIPVPKGPTFKSKKTTPHKVEEPDKTDPEVNSSFLELLNLTPAVIAYFKKRNISERTLKTFNIVHLETTKIVLLELSKKFDFNRLKQSGLLAGYSTPNKLISVFPDNCAIFPYFYKGRCEFIQARTISDTNKGKRWLNLNGVRIRTYNRDLLLQNKINEIYICEGATDALSAAELGYSAIALPGAGNRLTDDDLQNIKGKDIHIIPDRDEAGKRFSEAIKAQLKSNGIYSFIIQELPQLNCKDLNEYLILHRELNDDSN